MFELSDFRQITPGIDNFPGISMPRHRHLQAYATVVLAGVFEECGYAGRIRATAGDVLIHPALDCHGNQRVSDDVKLIRLKWSDRTGFGGFYRTDEIDGLARLAEKNCDDAAISLGEILDRGKPASGAKRDDWPDLLAATLIADPTFAIGVWAEANGLAPETVSRGFTLAFGVAPAVFRAEVRVRNAWLRITRGTEALSAIAIESGFSDQAHMTRWLRRITGASPAAWRRHSLSSQ